MPLAAVVVAFFLSHTAWRPVALAAHNGDLTATLTYEEGSSLYVRDAHLTLLKSRKLLIDRRSTGLWDGTIRLRFRNVWGDAAPELLVEAAACVNRCFDQLYVAIPVTRRVLRADFPAEAGTGAWYLERHAGRLEFESNDGRFFCTFSDCASASTPVQILAINSQGSAFVDLTRSRPELLRADARQQWSGYLQERNGRGGAFSWLGTLVPWCADEYRLGSRARADYKATCTRLVPLTDRRQMAKWDDWFST